MGGAAAGAQQSTANFYCVMSNRLQECSISTEQANAMHKLVSDNTIIQLKPISQVKYILSVKCNLHGFCSTFPQHLIAGLLFKNNLVCRDISQVCVCLLSMHPFTATAQCVERCLATDQTQGQYQTSKKMIQHLCTRLQTVSHAVHSLYWNKQCSRHLLCMVQLPTVGPDCAD